MHLKELFDYKNNLMKDICTNPDIVSLVSDKEYTDKLGKALAYSQVFPYEFVPETIDNAQTIICFDVDIDRVQNKTFYTPVIYIWVFTHKSLLKLTKGGVRLDEISIKIDEMLNGNRFYGLGELDLQNVSRFLPINDYQGRVLTYTARDFNRSQGKRIPANRKNP